MWVKFAPYGLIAVGLVLVFAFVHHLGYASGEAKVQKQLDEVILRDSQALAAQLERNAKDKANYDATINQISHSQAASQAELARLRAAPHPRLVCHTVPENGSGPVPEAAGAGPGAAPGAGKLPQETGFDPTAELYAEADRADTVVEACRVGLARRDAAIGG